MKTLSTKELATLVGINVNTLRSWIREGRITADERAPNPRSRLRFHYSTLRDLRAILQQNGRP